MINGAKDKCGSRASTNPLEADRRAMERMGANCPRLSKDVPAALPPGKGFASHSTSTAATSANQGRPVIVANTFARSRIVAATIARQTAPRGAPEIPKLKKNIACPRIQNRWTRAPSNTTRTTNINHLRLLVMSLALQSLQVLTLCQAVQSQRKRNKALWTKAPLASSFARELEALQPNFVSINYQHLLE